MGPNRRGKLPPPPYFTRLKYGRSAWRKELPFPFAAEMSGIPLPNAARLGRFLFAEIAAKVQEFSRWRAAVFSAFPAETNRSPCQATVITFPTSVEA